MGLSKISMQTVTETADILFPVSDSLHIQFFYHSYILISVAQWIPRWSHKSEDVGSRLGKRIIFLFKLFFHLFFFIIIITLLLLLQCKFNINLMSLLRFYYFFYPL